MKQLFASFLVSAAACFKLFSAVFFGMSVVRLASLSAIFAT